MQYFLEQKKDSERKSQSVEETILQKLSHAIRSYNIRYIKFVTDAHFDLNRTILAGANTINQLALSHAVYSADSNIQKSQFLQSKVMTVIPGKTFADAYLSRQRMTETKVIVNVGRFPWDNTIGKSLEVPPYGLFIVRPKSTSDITLVPAWYKDLSIPAKFINEIKEQIALMEHNLEDLRVILHELVYPEIQEYFANRSNREEDAWKELFDQYFHLTEKNPLLKRKYNSDDTLTNQLTAPYSYCMAFECTKRNSEGEKPAFSVILENFTSALFDIRTQIVSLIHQVPILKCII